MSETSKRPYDFIINSGGIEEIAKVKVVVDEGFDLEFLERFIKFLKIETGKYNLKVGKKLRTK